MSDDDRVHVVWGVSSSRGASEPGPSVITSSESSAFTKRSFRPERPSASVAKHWVCESPGNGSLGNRSASSSRSSVTLVEVDGAAGESNLPNQRLHELGQCRPCHFLAKQYGCLAGSRCTFCHLDHVNEEKRRRPGKSKRNQCKRILDSLEGIWSADRNSFDTLVGTLSTHCEYFRAALHTRLVAKAKEQDTQTESVQNDTAVIAALQYIATALSERPSRMSELEHLLQAKVAEQISIVTARAHNSTKLSL